MNETEDDIWNIMDDLKEEEYVKENGERDTNIVCSCGCSEFIVEDAMQICSKCSSICSKVIDNTAEWRYYGNDSKSDDPSRCGLPTNSLLPKSSLGSMIGGNKYGSNYDIRRIRKFIAWNSMPYNERTLWLVFDILTSNSLSNGIPQKVVDDAKVLYKNASEKKISRGDNKEGLIASCIYHSCLLNKCHSYHSRYIDRELYLTRAFYIIQKKGWIPKGQMVYFLFDSTTKEVEWVLKNENLNKSE